MTFWIIDWLRAFSLTLAVELLVALPLLANAEGTWLRRSAGVVLVNLATHPLVWFVFPALSLEYWLRTALSEAWAVAIEFAGYVTLWPVLGGFRAGRAALAANAASFAVGVLLRAYGYV